MNELNIIYSFIKDSIIGISGFILISLCSIVMLSVIYSPIWLLIYFKDDYPGTVANISILLFIGFIFVLYKDHRDKFKAGSID